MMRIGKFTDFYRDVTKAGTKIPQEKYLKVGHYPVIDQGRQAIVGRWDSDDGICKEIPAIIFGDHTRAIKYIEEPFFIGADGVKILRPVNVQDNPKYLYYALQAARIPNLGYSRHFKALKELDFHVCSIEKQDEIVRILEKIDYLIEQCHEEDSCLNQIVKSRFIELFGDHINEGGKPLSELATITGGLTKNSKRNAFNLKMPYLRVANVFFNRLDLNEILEIGVREDEIGKTLLQTGDLLFVEGNGSIEQIGRVAIWDGSISPILHQNHLIKARFHKKTILPEFALFYFMSQEGRQQIISKSVSTSGLNTLSVNKISGLILPMPPIELQNQFAAFVAQTDKSKLAVEKSLKQLEILKKSLMQQYFG